MNSKTAKRIRKLAKAMGGEKYEDYLKDKHKMNKKEFFAVIHAYENQNK